MNPIEAALFNLLYVTAFESNASDEVKEISKEAYKKMQEWLETLPQNPIIELEE